MSGNRWLLVGTFVCAAALGDPLAFAEDHPLAAASAEALVEQALANEIGSDGAERLSLLRQALACDSDSAKANWYSGRLRYQDRWVELAQMRELAASDPVIQEYQRLRRSAAPTAEDHLRLASWCKRHGLSAERIGELYAVLAANPNHVSVRRELGFVWKGSRWSTAEEIATAQRAAKAQWGAYLKWQPKMVELRRRLQLANTEAVAQAEQQLLEIDDAEAIFSMEFILSAVDERLADKVLDTLSAMKHGEATMSLARHAVLAPWDLTRRDAIEVLRGRPQSAVVPILISALSTPWQALGDFQLGYFALQSSFFREGFDSRQLHILNSDYRVVLTPSPGQLVAPTARNFMRFRLECAQIAMANDIEQRQEQLAAANEEIAATNARITTALAALTGQELGSEPLPWWDYWTSVSDTYLASKPVETSYQYQERIVTAPVPSYAPRAPRASCFAAGTPVWTTTGPKPIELVRVGDCVAAQDVATGELAFRPVMLTTVRPPHELLKLTCGGQTITCTRGHRFWVVGTGWVRADALAPGNRLHGAASTVVVEHSEPAEAARTFNMVVDESHTYFVGAEPVLVHDNTTAPEVNQPLPGMAAAN